MPRRKPNHISLSFVIAATGVEIMNSCDRCSSSSKRCIVSENSKNCSECVRTKKSCSLSASSTRELDQFLVDFERIEQERKEALEEEERLFTALSQARAKALRLAKQSEFLRKRGGQLIQRGVVSEGEAENQKSVVPSPTPPMDSSIGPSSFDFSLVDWSALGVFEKSPTPPPRSQGAQ